MPPPTDELITQPPTKPPSRIGGYSLRRRDGSMRPSYASSSASDSSDGRSRTRKRRRLPTPRKDSDSEPPEAPPDVAYFLKRPEQLIAETKPDKENKDEVKPVDLLSTDWPDWSAVGGLTEQLASLKECAVLPLLYPKLFSSRSPRGLLLSGPPGTGKTLAVRALAGTLKRAGCPVALFCRKGADVLSKYVGEGERQLRLLFEAARKHQPSIIFFDEIDGVAPVRAGDSGASAAHHSSLVATLLALMDGLEDRGEQVIVLGATNRPDAVDPALRRPGRFDREVRFEVPASAGDRLKILKACLRDWDETRKPDEKTLHLVAERSPDFTGADLGAVCAEATMVAIRRVFPQLYETSEKLQINPNRLRVLSGDFLEALKKVTPSSNRTAFLQSNAIHPPPHGIFRDLFEDETASLTDFFLHSMGAFESEFGARAIPDFFTSSIVTISRPDGHLDFPDAFSNIVFPGALRELTGQFVPHNLAHVHLQASLDELENPAMACQLIFSALRQAPAVVTIKDDVFDDQWVPIRVQKALIDAVKIVSFPGNKVFVILLGSNTPLVNNGPVFSPRLDITTFRTRAALVIQEAVQSAATDLQRLLEAQASSKRRMQVAVSPVKQKTPAELERLRIDASYDWPRKTPAEIAKMEEEENHWMRIFRIQVREVLWSLAKHPRYHKWFLKPVDLEVYPDYHRFVKKPMCLSDMMTRNDEGGYLSIAEIHDDLNLILENSEAYNDIKSDVVLAAREFKDRAALKLSCIDETVIVMSEKLRKQAESRIRYQNQAKTARARNARASAIEDEGSFSEDDKENQIYLPERVLTLIRDKTKDINLKDWDKAVDGIVSIWRQLSDRSFVESILKSN